MDPFVGEIRLFTGNFAPKGWALCNGQLLSIAQNTALFSLLGTFYGGNGTTNFGLPNFQGAFPMGQGQGPGLTQRNVGDSGGSASVALTLNEIPLHSHNIQVGTATTGTPGGSVGVGSGSAKIFRQAATSNLATLSPATLSAAGNSSPHENRQPYLALNFIIALQGVYPPRS